jgi:CRP-like cAMP-binding protein
MPQNHNHPLQLLLRQFELHSMLGEPARQAILDLPVQLKTLEAGSYLVREGDRPTTCGVLVSGYAYRQKETSDGLRQIVSLHIPGEALDLQQLYLAVADHSVQMLTRGQVAVIEQSHIRRLLAANAEVSNAVFTAVLVEGSIFREWVLNVGRRDARTRMAHLLCEFALRMEKAGLAAGDGFELPITQEQLADAVGLTPVHVNRTLKALEATGLITRNKRVIAFPSWERMRDVGDFNQRYLHLDGSPRARG